MVRKFSLVLSGGSALGFAHLGVIRFLEEEDSLPSEIVGTSMGALVGAAYAKCLDFDVVYEFFKSKSYFRLFKPDVFSRGNLVSSDKIREEIEDFLEGFDFGDLMVDLKVVATNSYTGESVVFDKSSGVSLVDALCASFSIPGVFKPYSIGSSSYYDGFLSSNLPFEFAKFRPFCSNVVNINLIHDSSNSLGNLRQTIIYLVNNQNNLKMRRGVDLLDLDVSQFTLFDFHKIDELVDLGYRQAKGL